jgi:hypothetical protein
LGADMTIYRNRRLLDAARNNQCLGCGVDDGTVVAAHYNGSAAGKGMGIKGSDAVVAFLCYRCHMDYDQGGWLTKKQKQLLWMTAFHKTCERIEEMGMADDEIRAEWDRFWRYV